MHVDNQIVSSCFQPVTEGSPKKADLKPRTCNQILGFFSGGYLLVERDTGAITLNSLCMAFLLPPADAVKSAYSSADYTLPE